MTIIDELLRPGVLALCQLRTHALKEVSDQHIQTVRTRLSRSASAVETPPSSSPFNPAQARHFRISDYKLFGLKAITRKIEKNNLQIMHAQPPTQIVYTC